MEVRRKTSSGGFSPWERGVSLLGREDLGSGLPEFCRRQLNQRNIALLLFGNFVGWWSMKYCLMHEVPTGQSMGQN